MLVWLGFLEGQLTIQPIFLSPTLWHAHELSFGWAVGIVAGFLLTAIQNWTGIKAIQGSKLALIVSIWFTARVLFLLSVLSPSLAPLGQVAIVADLLFLPIVGLFLIPYFKDPELKIERLFYVFFILITLGNALTYFSQDIDQAWLGIYLCLYTLVSIVLFIGGRVIPFFTEGTLTKSQPVTYPWVENGVFISSTLFFLLSLSARAAKIHMGMSELGTPFFKISVCVLGLVAFGFNLKRLSGWFVKRIIKVPLLWILHFGYLTLTSGFLLSSLTSYDYLPQAIATHAFTLGALGLIIIGMISRVSLGHTGRRLYPTKLTVVSFVTMGLAFISRVLVPATFPATVTLATYRLSGLFWILSMILFLTQFSRILFTARPKPKTIPITMT